MPHNIHPTRRQRISNALIVGACCVATVVLFGVAIFFQSTGVQ